MANIPEEFARSMETGLNSVLGLHIDDVSADRVTMSWTVGPEHLQPHGIVHGGLYCTVVEAAASTAGQAWLGDRGRVVGVSNHTDFLRATSEGQMSATALPIHRGRSQQLWAVEITDADQRLLARGQVRLQNLTP